MQRVVYLRHRPALLTTVTDPEDLEERLLAKNSVDTLDFGEICRSSG